MEMTGLWKVWKTKNRFPTLPTSPLEISPKGGEIPTFPQRRRRGPWKSGKPKAGFPLSHRHDSSLFRTKKQRRLGCAQRSNRLRPTGARAQLEPTKKEHSAAINGTEHDHDFRLIPHWNHFSVSGSFMDWKMLLGEIGRLLHAQILPAKSRTVS